MAEIDILHVDAAATDEEIDAIRKAWRDQTGGRECLVTTIGVSYEGTISTSEGGSFEHFASE